MKTMKLIFKTHYYQLFYIKDLAIIYIDWSESANKMTISELKQHIRDLVPQIETYQLSGFLINSQKGHFTMTIEIQEWHDQEIVPQYIKYGLKKLAFVLPEKDFFAAVSLQQTFDETQAKQLQTKFFSNLEDAMKWIA